MDDAFGIQTETSYDHLASRALFCSNFALSPTLSSPKRSDASPQPDAMHVLSNQLSVK